MKMDNCLLTLVFVLSMLGSLDGCNIYAAEGQNVTVRLDYNLQNSDTLKWRFNENTIFHRKRKTIVTKAPAGVEVYQNGSLKLTNLKKNNAGTYTPDVHTQNGISVKQFKPIKLCIFDSFPDPVVKFECSKTTPTMVTFTCNVSKAQGLTFKWLKNKKEMKEKTQILKQKAEDVEEDSFECIVSNPALSKTSKAVQHECTSSKLFGLDFWIMVGILGGGGGLVLLLIIIVIFCCVWARKTRSMKVKDEGNSCLLTYSTDEEELRLEWTNSEQQHHHHKHNHLPGYHHHHHHHHQQQPVSHTGPRTASSSSSAQEESPQNAKSVTPY